MRISIVCAISLAFSALGCGGSPAHGDAPEGQVDASPTDSGALVLDGISGAFLTAASSGQEVVVFYEEKPAGNDGGAAQSKMQWIDAEGKKKGAPFALSSSPDFLRDATVATDGSRILVCSKYRPACEALTATGKSVTGSAAFHEESQGINLSYNRGTWMLAYAQGRANVLLQRLNEDASPSGVLETIKVSVDEPSFSGSFALAAQGTGFTLVAGDPMKLYRIGADAQVVSLPIDLGVHPWNYASVAGTTTTTVVNVSFPYGSYMIFLEDDGNRLVRLKMQGGFKEGLNVRLAAGSNEFAAGWQKRGSLTPQGVHASIATSSADFDNAPLLFDEREGQVQVLTIGSGFVVMASDGVVEWTMIRNKLTPSSGP